MINVSPCQVAAEAGALGRIKSVSLSEASILLPVIDTPSARTTVGKYVGISNGTSVLVAIITHVTHEGKEVIGQVGLLGEIRRRDNGELFFQRGVTDYPAIGDPARVLSTTELHAIFDHTASTRIRIGQLQQDASVTAYLDVDSAVTKHFAVLGSTGVGKSSGVVLLLRQIIEARPDLRVVVVDAHNEYGRCFGDRASLLNPKNLRLPFWLFNLEEIADVFYRARRGAEEEIGILAELIPIAKNNFAASRASDGMAVRKSQKGSGFTSDTPVPYRIEDLLTLIDARMGKLENRASLMHYSSLMMRIETARNDPRYAFMFDNANVGGDSMPDVLSVLFRLPARGKPMTVMQLAGFPAEVVDSIISVLGRMAFEFGLWSDGAAPLLFVCEEAHRYAPADRTIGFEPTRKALSRIAKEGRKYGVSLALVTQRPAELDATIVSQCSTLFAMRMANERDQAIVRAAVSDAGARLLEFVSSLGTREVFAFGEGVALPTRLHFEELPPEQVPRSEALRDGRPPASDSRLTRDFLEEVVERWRSASMSSQQRLNDGAARVLEAFGRQELVGGALRTDRSESGRPGRGAELPEPSGPGRLSNTELRLSLRPAAR